MDAPSLQSEDLANKLAFLGVLEFFLASWRPWRLIHLPIPEGSSECKQASQLPPRRKPIHVFEPGHSTRRATRNRKNSAEFKPILNHELQQDLLSSTCHPPPLSRIIRKPNWRGGRAAEGDGLLNRYTGSNPYPGFESPPLRFRFST
jgi:hypothetical protein